MADRWARRYSVLRTLFHYHLRLLQTQHVKVCHQQTSRYALLTANRRWLGQGIGTILAATACVGLVRAQLARGYAAGDQSGATHFSSYARAVLGPLPPRSIFLINNDQMVRERKSFGKTMVTHCFAE